MAVDSGAIVRFVLTSQPGRRQKPTPPAPPPGASLPSVRAHFGERGHFNFLRADRRELLLGFRPANLLSGRAGTARLGLGIDGRLAVGPMRFACGGPPQPPTHHHHHSQQQPVGSGGGELPEHAVMLNRFPRVSDTPPILPCLRTTFPHMIPTHREI